MKESIEILKEILNNVPSKGKHRHRRGNLIMKLELQDPVKLFKAVRESVEFINTVVQDAHNKE